MKKTASLLAGVIVAGALSLPAAHAVASTTTPECGNADLRASFGNASAGMSHVFGDIRLTNISAHSCWVQGYGGLSFVGDGNGTQIGKAAVRTPSKTPRVVLAPGQRAASAIEMTTTGPYSRKTCRPARINGFRVYAPNATASQFVPHRTQVCSNPDLTTLWHKAFHAA